MNSPNIPNFWTFVAEREAIRLRKEAGESPPWSDSEILNTFHFCNVRRQDDKGTRWYMENVVPAAEDDPPDLLWRTTLYRAVNNVAWFQKTFGNQFMYCPVFGHGEWGNNREALVAAIQDGDPPYSPAHIVLQGPDRRSRKDHLLELLEFLNYNLQTLHERIEQAPTLESIWEILQDIPYVGPFISLQIYRDLLLAGHPALSRFNDNDFTYLGPGARKALLALGAGYYGEQYVLAMNLQKSSENTLGLSLGDIEHTLCEGGKFWRLQEGKGRRRYYRGAGISAR